jgi:hypothetical protein
MSEELAHAPAIELAARIRRRDLSPVELIGPWPRKPDPPRPALTIAPGPARVRPAATPQLQPR